MVMLPADNMILLSVINTKLRDYYKNLDELCDDMGESRDEIEKRLKLIDYSYSEELNRFI